MAAANGLDSALSGLDPITGLIVAGRRAETRLIGRVALRPAPLASKRSGWPCWLIGLSGLRANRIWYVSRLATCCLAGRRR